MSLSAEIRNQEGEIFTCDINTNTNYNSDDEARAGKSGILELVKFGLFHGIRLRKQDIPAFFVQENSEVW